MIDNLLGGDDDGDSGESSADSELDGGLFDGPENGETDDLMGEDDLMGGDDMGFDDMDDGGNTTSAEMENRIDEIENEVSSLSSTVGTVKSENELISESVDDVEENIRKLLEVYEMVTRGVNPFVDESEMGNAFASGGDGGDTDNSMGLFGDDEEETSEKSDVDDSIVDADADDFFDGDLEDDDDLDDGFDDFDDDIDEEDDEFEDFEAGDDAFDTEEDFEESASDENSGGKSFEELKAEYDSGEADWDNGESSADNVIDHGRDEEGIETTIDPEGDVDDGTDGNGTDTEISRRREQNPATSDGKPYLEALPSGYIADIVVMDWLEFLVEEAGVDGAARTIAYYEAIEWIDEPAANSLQTFLNGFGGDVGDDPEPRSSLTISHHNASLRFISRIVNPDLELVSFGGGSGPQRVPREETSHMSGTGTMRGSNDRLESVRSPAERVGEPPGERYEIEPDGGCERSGMDAFNWGEDRTD